MSRTLPSAWWWDLASLAARLILDEDSGRQALGHALTGVCQVFAPSAFAREVAERLGDHRSASAQGARPLGVSREAYEAFYDLRHLALPADMRFSDRKSKRRRKRAPVYSDPSRPRWRWGDDNR